MMDILEGESEWSLTVPAHYPSEARAVRVDSREINQIWYKLNLICKNLLKFLRVPKRRQ